MYNFFFKKTANKMYIQIEVSLFLGSRTQFLNSISVDDRKLNPAPLR